MYLGSIHARRGYIYVTRTKICNTYVNVTGGACTITGGYVYVSVINAIQIHLQAINKWLKLKGWMWNYWKNNGQIERTLFFLGLCQECSDQLSHISTNSFRKGCHLSATRDFASAGTRPKIFSIEPDFLNLEWLVVEPFYCGWKGHFNLNANWDSNSICCVWNVMSKSYNGYMETMRDSLTPIPPIKIGRKNIKKNWSHPLVFFWGHHYSRTQF